jgi:hypothetical protein
MFWQFGREILWEKMLTQQKLGYKKEKKKKRKKSNAENKI